MTGDDNSNLDESDKDEIIITKIGDEDQVYNSVFGLSIASAYWKLNRKSLQTSSATKSIVISFASGSIISDQRQSFTDEGNDQVSDAT